MVYRSLDEGPAPRCLFPLVGAEDAMTLDPKNRRSSASASRFLGSTESNCRKAREEEEAGWPVRDGPAEAEVSSPYLTLSSANALSRSSISSCGDVSSLAAGFFFAPLLGVAVEGSVRSARGSEGVAAVDFFFLFFFFLL